MPEVDLPRTLTPSVERILSCAALGLAEWNSD
jgi:hypothetical protein